MPDLDDALRADASAWRAETDAAYVGRRDWSPAPKQPGRLLPALAAAVVAALVAIGVGVAVHRSGHDGTTPAAAALPSTPARIDKLDLLTTVGAFPPDDAGDVRVVTDTAEPGYISTRWELTKIGDGGRTLYVSYEIGSGSCDKEIGFRVMQTDASVELTSVVHHAGGGFCTDDLRIGGGVIHLDKPLGHRQLLHAPVTP